MLANQIGYYSLILGFFFSILIIPVSIKNFNNKNEINVSYSGSVPNLFAEGKGVVAEGYLKDKNYFNAVKILAKHDENYMPPEIKEALGKE